MLTPLILVALAQQNAAALAIGPAVGDGLSADEIVRVEKAVRAAVETTKGFGAVVPEAATQKALERSKLSCDPAATECLVQYAVVIIGDSILGARLKRGGIELVVVDVASAAITARATGILDVSRPEEGATQAAQKLLTDDAKRVRLVVKAPSGASVSVDGAESGTGPVELTKIAQGNHTIEVRQRGKAMVRQTVDVRLGEVTKVDMTAPPTSTTGAETLAKDTDTSPTPAPTAKEPSLLPWVGAGAGAVVAVVGGAMLGIGSGSFFELEAKGDKLRDSTTVDQALANRGDYDKARDAWDAGGAQLVYVGTGLIVGGAVAAIAGVATGLAE